MASDRRRWRVREKMEGDRKFQRGNLSEVQNLSEENKRKRKRREFLRNLF